MDSSPLSSLARSLISAFEVSEAPTRERKIAVNPVVSKFAAWYEKFRNVMDYREEEVILRAAIERILKRRLLLGGNGKTVAESLVRELVWARYFPNESIPVAMVEKVETKIDLFLELRRKILLKHHIGEITLNEWIYHLLSSSLEKMLNPNKGKEVVSNLMFHLLREQITISDDSNQARDAQVFIAVRRAFAKDDIAFLRYHLFTQFFGELTLSNLEEISENFLSGYKEIQRQLNYPLKDRIFGYIRRRTAVFLILEDILRTYTGKMQALYQNEEEVKKAVFAACETRYNTVASKVRRAIVRSVIFILLTKAIFALFIEGTFDKLVYGKILWRSIVINTAVPPLLMLVVGFFIRAPGKNNSEHIFSYIRSILFDQHPSIGGQLILKKSPDGKRPILSTVFTVSWLLAFVLTFGAIIYALTKLHFNIASQGVFLFFLAIVSFLAYRIALIPKTYMVEEAQGLLTPVVDFFFMPVVKVGRHLTEGIYQINILIFIFDFIIETPFKGIFAFFEQWFFFLHAKREELE